MEMQQKIAALADSFSDCSCILAAMGDEPRQHLILEMLRMGRCSGLRVCEITEKTNLLDPEMESFEKLISTLLLAKEISGALPDRSGSEE